MWGSSELHRNSENNSMMDNKKIIISLVRVCLLLAISQLITAAKALAQDGGAKGPSQVGLFYGRVLPNGVDQDDEIFPMWGGRYSMPLSETGFWDVGGYWGDGSGVDWKAIFTTLSAHIPVETLIGHAGLGVDISNYTVDNDSAKTALGLHFVGGVMAKLGGSAALRFDMKLTTKPGTSLFFGLGIVIGLGGGGAQ